ncbi:hypothetical protein P4H65_06460 [Paenibacillus chitinolyticus]|uniref:hypothetical protein n=1 Tax=Paenibacillus chitinolyticus TaxID=79263 RepID=UPI002DBCC69C|nr:hypothetical protein [Paenibacillus chitinolyticus]MEC0245437.1 hypothetical protein [Paenibacillus chitinolyticus]
MMTSTIFGKIIIKNISSCSNVGVGNTPYINLAGKYKNISDFRTKINKVQRL